MLKFLIWRVSLRFWVKIIEKKTKKINLALLSFQFKPEKIKKIKYCKRFISAMWDIGVGKGTYIYAGGELLLELMSTKTWRGGPHAWWESTPPHTHIIFP
jgi:hypothetical protein